MLPSAPVIAVANQKGRSEKPPLQSIWRPHSPSPTSCEFCSSAWTATNLTSGVGLKEAGQGGTIYHALTGDVPDVGAFVLPTRVERLSLMRRIAILTGAEVELVSLPNREHRLRLMLTALLRSVRLHLHRHAAVRSASSRSML